MTDTIRVLGVDDDPDIGMIVELALALDPAMAVRIAASGDAAVELVETGAWQPDCILLDDRLTNASGAEVLARLRTVPTCATTPIIFLTGNVTSADIARHRSLGAIGTIGKPFDPLRLAAEVRRLLAASA